MTPLIKITGATRLYCIIGDPIAQVRSPETFTARFAAAGIDAVLVPVHVPSAKFDTIVPGLLAIGNLDGVLVTVPHKARMGRFADRLGATAQAIGAINALRREADGSWSGDMFDGIGFVRGAQRQGERLKGRRVALFGAGGAGSAIAFALADAGVAAIDIIDTDAAKAGSLADKLRPLFRQCRLEVAEAVPEGIDMVVNASPVGMGAQDGLPGPVRALDRSVLVGDVVIRESPTALIRLAMDRGCRWVDGRDMHGGQIDAIVAFFASARSDAPSPVATH